MFNSFWKWCCVYLRCRLLEAMRDSRSSWWSDLASHIKAEFAISRNFLCRFFPSSAGRRAVTQVAEVTTVFGILSRPPQPVWRGQWLRSHRFENRRGLSQRWKTDRGGEDEGRRRLAAGTGSVLVWRKSRHELHLWAVIERVSRVWFGDVRKWTELPQLTGSWYISQVTVGMGLCNTLGMVAVSIKYTDEVNPGKSHYLLWSSLIKYQSQSYTEHTKTGW